MKMMKQMLIPMLVLLISYNVNSQISYDSNEDVVFKDLRKALLQRQSVYNLDLSGQRLKEIPNEVKLFENLRTLDVSNNEITDLKKDDFKGLKKLEGINLYANKLKKIPEELYEINTLEELNLGANKIKEIGEGIKNLKYLTIFKLHHNDIERINGNWGLKNLKRLRLDGNKLKELPEELFIECPLVTYCNLNVNKLKKLPESIYSSSIKHLDLGSNEIENIGALKRLSSLNYLVLDWNNLKEEEVLNIIEIKRLQILSMENCGLTKLPEQIQKMKNLRELSLIDNHIEALPKSMINLKRLEKLWLEGNPISDSDKKKIKQALRKVDIKA